jgi:hypothetical protein
MRLVALCVVVAAAALAVTAKPAHACSCAIVDAREALTRFDAAFIGTIVERKDEWQGGVTLVFRVEERFKGSLGATVDVRTASNGAACGIEAPVGSRVGLFLERENGRWIGSLCSEVEPARLRGAARPLPAPNGKGAVALLVGGRFGTARVLALDRRGRTLAYGNGTGSVIAMSPCPGGRRLAEVAQTQGGIELAVRELRTLRVVRRQQLTQPVGTFPTALSARMRRAPRWWSSQRVRTSRNERVSPESWPRRPRSSGVGPQCPRLSPTGSPTSTQDNAPPRCSRSTCGLAQ